MDFFDSSFLSADGDLFPDEPHNDDHISAILDSIQETDNAEVLITLIENILHEKFQSLSTLSRKARVIDVCLSASKKCLANTFLTTGNILNKNSQICQMDDEDALRKNLKICLSVLEMVILNLNCVIGLAPVKLDAVKHVPKDVASILLEVFSHCKNSESCYSAYFQQMSSLITTIFKKCHELQVLYFVVLSVHIEFDLSQCDQMSVFIEVLNSIVDIGEIVVALDVKTTAEEWKGYMKICEKYAGWLKNKYVHHKASKYLCEEVQNHLNLLITDKQDTKTVIRTLKMTNFIIKILIKLSETFCGYLSLHMDHFSHMLATLLQFSGPHLQYLGIEASLIDGITSHITVGVEPFLVNLLPDCHFRKSFMVYIKTLSHDSNLAFGCLMLTASVMKLLLKADEVVRCQWIDDSEDSNVICCLFQVISTCNFELQKMLKFTGSVMEDLSLYDHILIHCAALIVSCYSLETVEKLMLSAILNEDIWSKLMALDLWYILSRYGSPEYCFDQMNYFIGLFNSLHQSKMLKNTPQDVLVGHHIQKLYCLLPNKFKSQVYMKYPPLEYTHLWKYIGLHNKPDEVQLLDCKKICTDTNALLQNFIVKTNASVKDYTELKQMLVLTSSIPGDLFLEIEETISSSLVLNIVRTWNRVTLNEKMNKYVSKKESSVEGVEWFNEFVITLSQVTSILASQITNSQWASILEVLIQIVTKSSSCIQIAALDFLESIIFMDIANDEHKNDMSMLVAKLFHLLLESDEDIIRVISMEAFSYFTQNTPNVHIIVLIFSQNDTLKERFKNFQFKVKQKANEKIHKKAIPTKFIHKCETQPTDILHSTDLDSDIFSSIDFDLSTEKQENYSNKDVEISDILNKLKENSLALKNICSDVKLSCENRNKLVDIKNVIDVLLN